MRYVTACIVSLCLAAGITLPALAAIPFTINVQGRLTDAAGQPIGEQEMRFDFKIFNAEAAGIEMWPKVDEVGERHALIPDAQGLWTTDIGSVYPITPEIFLPRNEIDDSTRWLQITVEGTALPRVRLRSGPYSMKVGSLDGAAGGDVYGNISLHSQLKVGDEAGDAGRIKVTDGAQTTITLEGTTGDVIATGKASIGPLHTVSGSHTFVAGYKNMADGDNANVTGDTCYALATDATVGGGSVNAALAEASTIGGGRDNYAHSRYSAIGGGHLNTVSGEASVVSGGSSNQTDSTYATVGGGINNAAGYCASVLGGRDNAALVNYATVAGGQRDTAFAPYSTIAGGMDNGAHGDYSYIGGGQENTADSGHASIGGGESNHVTHRHGTVGGGFSNTAGWHAVVGGGRLNEATGDWSTIAGGTQNTASGGSSAVGGGAQNLASGNGATIPGGRWNRAEGDNSFAAGGEAQAAHDGVVVISAKVPGVTDSIRSSAFGQMVLRAQGRFYLTDEGGDAVISSGDFLNTSTGAHLTTGGDWTNSSDANKKENFRVVDTEELLDKLAALPIAEWNYKSEDDAVRHIGPTAQDFYALFGVGTDDKSISTIDPAGIALATIQELSRRNAALEDRVAELSKLVEELRRNNTR